MEEIRDRVKRIAEADNMAHRWVFFSTGEEVPSEYRDWDGDRVLSLVPRFYTVIGHCKTDCPLWLQRYVEGKIYVLTQNKACEYPHERKAKSQAKQQTSDYIMHRIWERDHEFTQCSLF